MNIAIIPARGGSKRILRKNIKEFFGKPMIAWSIEAARSSGLFDHIIVSTDDAEIAEVARHWGAEVPFMRPAELSDDHAGTTEVLAHSSQWAIDQGFKIDAFCCIYATAPFIQAEDLCRGLELLKSGEWVYALAVTDFAAPIFRSFKELPEGGMTMFFPEHFLTRSQDLPIAFHDAGQFCWGRPTSWIERIPALDRYTVLVKVPRWRVQDIDTPEDWKRSEILAPLILSNL